MIEPDNRQKPDITQALRQAQQDLEQSSALLRQRGLKIQVDVTMAPVYNKEDQANFAEHFNRPGLELTVVQLQNVVTEDAKTMVAGELSDYVIYQPRNMDFQDLGVVATFITSAYAGGFFSEPGQQLFRSLVSSLHNGIGGLVPRPEKLSFTYKDKDRDVTVKYSGYTSGERILDKMWELFRL